MPIVKKFDSQSKFGLLPAMWSLRPVDQISDDEAYEIDNNLSAGCFMDVQDSDGIVAKIA